MNNNSLFKNSQVTEYDRKLLSHQAKGLPEPRWRHKSLDQFTREEILQMLKIAMKDRQYYMDKFFSRGLI